MSTAADRLWALLPEVYRIRDVETGGPLREFIELLAREAEVIEQELDQRYDDLFIETAAEWATGYLGELVGHHRLGDASPSPVSPRAQIADTVALRRRKGTASMLERLAIEVTGWPAVVVEDFERIIATQFLNHVRPAAVAVSRVSGPPPLEPVHSPFDLRAHTVDVRRVDAPAPHRRGRFNLPDVAVFVWRTSPVRILRARAVPVPGGAGRYRFDQLGMDAPLYVAPPVDRDPDARTRPPLDVPRPLGRSRLRDHRSDLVGTARSITIERRTATQISWSLEEATKVRASDLSDEGASWANKPPPGTIAIDPVLGRLWFGTSPAPTTAIAVTFHHGLAVPVGARAGQVPGLDPAAPRLRDGGDPAAALATAGTGGTLVFGDSLHYGPVPTVRADPGKTVQLHADDRTRPVLEAPQGIRLELGPGATLVLGGLVITGGPLILDEQGDLAVRNIVLRDCTLVPGRRRTADGGATAPDAASLIVLDPFANVRLERCVTGAVVAVEGAEIDVVDSIVDAGNPSGLAFGGRSATTDGAGNVLRRIVPPAPDDTTTPAYTSGGATAGGRLRLCATTVVGGIHATSIDATDAIVLAELPDGEPASRRAAVVATERQQDCVRYSWLPPDSRVGRRFECLPEAVSSPPWPRPRHTSLRFGHPGYGRLDALADDPIRSAAHDGGEPGVSHQLSAPQRERDLRVRLDEYLRFGLEAGIFHADDVPSRSVEEGGQSWLPI